MARGPGDVVQYWKRGEPDPLRMGAGGGRLARFEGSQARLVLWGGLALLGGGAAAHLAGAAGLRDAAWALVGVVGALWSGVLLVVALLRGRIGVDAIAVLAVAGALAVGEFLAAAVITMMLASGRILEDRASRRARAELTALVQRAPRVARRYQAGRIVEVLADRVTPGDLLVVGPGEIVPVDGRVESAVAVLDESALTGEAAPCERPRGDGVRSGVVNAGGPFDLRATTTAAESTYAGIVRLVEAASAASAPFVRMADRYATWFVPLTLLLAGGAWAVAGDPVRAVAVLVVATPCPLILAAPVAIVSGLSRAARHGVIIKGGSALERLATCRSLVLDKTGTLTSGRPVVTDVVTGGDRASEVVLGLAALLDQVSPHVLAGPIVQEALDRDLDLQLPVEVTEVPGQGIRGRVGDRNVSVGKSDFVTTRARPEWWRIVQRRAASDGDMTVFVSVDGEPAGVVVLRDKIRVDAAQTVRRLRLAGIDRVVLATGDRVEIADTVGAVVGADLVLAERLPEDKLAVVRAEQRRGPVVMVGDGINDAAALALAEAGVALGARGATVASEAADIVVTVDRLDRLATAMEIARRSRHVAAQSVIVGMGLSLGAMGLAAWGLLVPVAGALAQEAIDLTVIANALRAAHGPTRRVRLDQDDLDLWRRFSADHDRLWPLVAEIRHVADALDTQQPGVVRARLDRLRDQLIEDLEPHELAEGAELYPVLDRLLGSPEATAPMNRAHVEISHYVHRLDRLLDQLPEDGPGPDDTAELRRILYGLHAIAELHFVQEEQGYFTLIDTDGT